MEDEEGDVDLYEELLRKHRKEKKELQCKVNHNTKYNDEKNALKGKLQALKKSAAKGDKKKKKEVLEEMAALEAELGQKQENEILEFKANGDDTVEITEGMANGLSLADSSEPEVSNKVSRAQKRRERKVTKFKEREMDIVQEQIANLGGARHMETREIRRLLKSKDLSILDIPSDGDCLYNAVLRRMQLLEGSSPTLKEIRSSVADFLRANKSEYLPYLSHPDTGNMLTDAQYEEYCDQIANTPAWGGEVELKALAEVLKRPIEVIQQGGPPVLLGENHAEESGGKKPITLTYHRHMYGLGAHYNTTQEYRNNSESE